MALTIETCVARHIGDRREQQDRVDLFVHPAQGGTMLAVLADGMGGHSGGALAAEQVLLRAKQCFEAYTPATEMPAHLLAEIVNEAHTVIRLTRFTSEKDPHSTAVVMMLQPGEVNWVHCGDSRLYHFRGTELVSRTLDHSLVNDMVRKGKLDAASAARHPQRNVLLSCLGSDEAPRLVFGRTAPLTAGDSFLLCSDGLWDHFSDDELADAIESRTAREAARVLVTQARKRAGGYGDNISLAIIKLIELQKKT